MNDKIYTSNSMIFINEFKKNMMLELEKIDLGLLHYFLGMKIIQDTNRIFLCQEKYARDLLKKFNMSNCKPAKTPMNINL